MVCFVTCEKLQIKIQENGTSVSDIKAEITTWNDIKMRWSIVLRSAPPPSFIPISQIYKLH